MTGRLRRWAAPPGEALGGRRLLAVAVTLGILGGAGESAYRVLWHVLENHPSREFAWEWVWMAPLSAAGAFLLVALPLAGVGAAARRSSVGLWRPRPVLFGFGALAAWGVLHTPPPRLAPYAVLLLTVGVASALAGGPAPARRAARLAGALWVLGPLLLLSTAIGVLTLPGPLERVRLSRLPEADARLPNVVLVILDTVRAANLGLYGNARAPTPRLDAWGARGVLFEAMIAPSPWTLPSHASVFTGVLPGEHSARPRTPLDGALPTLAEQLSARGYAAAGFVANFANTTAGSGLARGFSRWEDFPVTWGRLLAGSWLARTLMVRLGAQLRTHPWRMGEKDARANTDDALRWLAQRGDERPFFVFMNYMDAHAPYRSPASYRARFGVRPEDVVLDWREGLDPAALAGTEAAYDAALGYLDDEVDRLLRAAVTANGRETLVVVTSDHGEFFGEHGLIGHGNALYLPVLHVPLLMAGPGVPVGRVVQGWASLADLPATLLELVTGDPGPLGGVSLARRWEEDPSADPHPVAAVLEGGDWLSPWEPGSRGFMTSVLEGPWHYIRNGDEVEELYDVAADPDEHLDLAKSERGAEALPALRAAAPRPAGPE